MTHTASNPVMCHVNPINIQPKPVGCQNDFSIQKVLDPIVCLPPKDKIAVWPRKTNEVYYNLLNTMDAQNYTCCCSSSLVILATCNYTTQLDILHVLG